MIYAVAERSSTTSSMTDAAFCERPLSTGLFAAGALLMAVDAVCSNTLSMVVTKQWVVLLLRGGCEPSAEHSSEAAGEASLALANAVLSRIDLGVAMLSPLAVSALIRRFGGSFEPVLLTLVGHHVLSACAICASAARIQRLRPAMFQAPAPAGAPPPAETTATAATAAASGPSPGPGCSGLQAFQLLPRRVRAVSVAYCCLYFSVLSPGALLTGWLQSARVRAAGGSATGPNAVAAFRAVVQVPLIFHHCSTASC
jgi:hypothetical protein